MSWPASRDRGKRRHRKIRGAHEDQAERHYSAARFAALVNFLTIAVALELRDVVDEQHAVEVVDLVLDAGGVTGLGVLFVLLAVEIEEFHLHPRRPLDVLSGCPGSTGSLPRKPTFSSDDQAISGLMKTRGSLPRLPSWRDPW